ncbi:DUF5688 family protein [Faecalicatena contorta]|uniref:DUF5688 family protein n=1 Tax=Faecalicatena contorta TaxID=39482 RepID=UPI0018993563|nr:DUF5688 family protein [Faecalicatena contorta]
MMTYQEFAQRVEEKLPQHLSGDLHGSAVSLAQKEGNNGQVRTGVSIRPQGSNVSPMIYLEECYSSYLKGENLEQILEQLGETARDAIPDWNVLQKFQMDQYENVKDSITCSIVNKKANGRLLKRVPHKNFEDLSIIYQVEHSVPEGNMLVKITNQHLEQWNIGKNELHETALANMQRIKPPVFNRMEDTMMNILDPANEEQPSNLFEDEEVFRDLSEDKMYVLTNGSNSYGASSILYPGVLDKIGECLQDDLHILPSSIHELIILRKRDSLDARELGEMVREINQTQVQPEEVLSDRAYEYNREARQLSQLRDSIPKEKEMCR